MPIVVRSVSLVGIDGFPVEIEVDLINRLPATIIVGLPGSAIRESTHRVRSAIASSDRPYPRKRVVVNLAPADVPKVGTGFDLPIAVAIVCAGLQSVPGRLQSTAFVGELSLDGALKPISGALSVAIAAAENGISRIVLPTQSAREAAVVDGIAVHGAATLAEVIDWVSGDGSLESPTAPQSSMPTASVDMSEVRGQHQARRGLEIAAAGGHNLLMMGPPGCGKTMLATRMATILPRLDRTEALEITRIHAAAGLIAAGSGLVTHRPFRAPHHSVTSAGLLGNARLEPGEVSLAHRGVLFLDELPEFRRSALELLRGPLESRQVRLTRARGTAVFPASFSLIAAANPCPCGFRGHPSRPCVCTPTQVDRYEQKLSGPMLDRIDMMVWTQPVEPLELERSAPGESSRAVRHRVDQARALQNERFRDRPLACNAELAGDAIREAADASPAALRTLRAVCETNAFSGRGWSRILKVARTIADLVAEQRVNSQHVLEASSYRLPSGIR